MRHRSLAGFTLVEVAVSAALIALLAAVTAPYLVSFMDNQRAQTTADKLADLAQGIANYENVIKTGTAGSTLNSYPGLLSELDTLIIAASTVTHNSCGTGAGGTYNVTAVTAWNNNGPFVSFYIPKTGIVTPLGVISDSVVRTPLSATVGTMAIRMMAIDSSDAVSLDAIVDGGDGGTLGTLRYTIGTTTAHMADVRYTIPLAAKC